jgi:hypothetical protein
MEQQILWEYSIVFLLFLLIIGFSVFRVVKSYIYKHKMKKLKYEWTWVLKKTKVLAVRERYVSGGEDSSWYYLYRLESEDETSNIYVSESFKDAKHGWRSLEEMRVKYDGVIYDLWNRDEAIRQINDNIHRLEMELQNDPWFFKKRELKKDIESMKKYIDIANEWPITPYLIINSHKISEWDSIDVYVNPDKPEQYYFDLDFTKEN